jgi:hypothetical protein|tara:strand:+ start:263 stop:568 length:306 start_codon:yes stop_codon:yes gene_type:complete
MITTLLTIALVSSTIINIIFVWYTRKLLNYLEMTQEEARDVLESVSEYENHLTDVYGRDIFYGDSTLESLLEHTTKLADQMQTYVEVNQELTNKEPEKTDA